MRRTLPPLVLLLAVLTACGSDGKSGTAAPAPTAATATASSSRPSPSAAPTTPTSAPPSSAQPAGPVTDLGTCTDGECLVRISGVADIPFDQSAFGFASMHVVVDAGGVSLSAARGGSQVGTGGSAGGTMVMGFSGFRDLRIVPTSITGDTAVLQISPA